MAKGRRAKRLLGAAPFLGLILIAVFFMTIRAPFAATASTGETVTIMVLGDSLGEGLYAGLYRLVKNNPNIQVNKQAEVGAGLHKLGMDSWKKKLDRLMPKVQPDVALIWMGGNDPQPIIHDGRQREPFRSEAWRTLYTERAGEYIESLKSHGLYVFWIGLPVMRDAAYDEDIQYLNGIIEEVAKEHGIPFISTRSIAVGEDGGYDPFGLDLSGRRRQLRMNDGKHYTLNGYQLVASKIMEQVEAALPQLNWGQ